MLVTNQRLDKLAAARVDFVNCGMLDPKNQQHLGMISVSEGGRENRNGDEPEDEPEEAEHPLAGPSGTAQVQMVTGNVTLACTRGIYSQLIFSLIFSVVHFYLCSLEALAVHINQCQLPALAHCFLFDQLNKNTDSEITSDDIDLEDCPVIEGRISVFHSAIASLYAPSDECGLRGMC